MGPTSVAVVAISASEVLQYAAAFFFVVFAVASAYALVKLGNTLGRAERVLDDVDTNAVPLLQKAGTTLDEVNANLGNVDQITKDVANITDRLDNVAGAVEGAVSGPARKAAAFSAGVQSAVSSFMRRDQGAAAATADDAAGQADAGAAWTYQAPPPDAPETEAPAADAPGTQAGEQTGG